MSLDGYSVQEGFVNIPLWKIAKNEWDSYRVHDLLSGASYHWQGARNFVRLDPHILPFHLFRIEDY